MNKYFIKYTTGEKYGKSFEHNAHISHKGNKAEALGEFIAHFAKLGVEVLIKSIKKEK